METLDDLGQYTFEAVLNNSVKKFSDRPALGFVGEASLTYAQVYTLIREIRERLHQMGVKKGDRVALYSPSVPHWGIVYFAIVTFGAIAVHLLHDFNKSEAESCITHSGAKVVFVAEKLHEKIEHIQTITHIVGMEDLSLKRGHADEPGKAPLNICRPEDTASIIYTSGTTGRSKGVELTHENLVFTAVTGQACQRINKYDVSLSILPISHVYEFTVGFLMFFLNGAEVRYLQGLPVPRILLPALKEVRPNMMLVVPLVIEKIYKQQIVPAFSKSAFTRALAKTRLGYKFLCRIAGKKLKKTFGGRLKFFGIGGAKVDPVVEQFMKYAKFPYSLGYGLTETSPLVTYASVRNTRPGELGIPVPGVSVKILDPDPETGVGELGVKGKNVMKGYYKAPELTAQAFTEDGWFKTGDLCLIKKDGWIVIKGRSKNMILGASGENIYPEDIEFVLNQHPLVTDALVVEGENASLVAYVQVDEKKIETDFKESGKFQSIQEAVADFTTALAYRKEELLNEVKFFVNQNVNKFSRIDTIKAVQEFEKTASKKIKRYLYSIAGNLNRKKDPETNDETVNS